MISPPNCPKSPLFRKSRHFFCVCSRLLRWGWKIQMNDNVWIVTTPIISRLFSLLVINQQSNSSAMLCDESTWNKSLELCSRIEQWFGDRWTSSAVLYLNYLFINHSNGIVADDRKVETRKSWNSNRCKREFCENNFLMNFEFHITSSRSDRVSHSRLVEINDRFQCYDFLDGSAVHALALSSLQQKHSSFMCTRDREVKIGKLLLHKCIKRVSEKWKMFILSCFSIFSPLLSVLPRLRQLFHSTFAEGLRVLQCCPFGNLLRIIEGLHSMKLIRRTLHALRRDNTMVKLLIFLHSKSHVVGLVEDSHDSHSRRQIILA